MDAALAKEEALKRDLAGLGRALVAFSAGVDSTYLLDVGHAVLGARIEAVTADSPSLARSSLDEARAFCAARGIAHRVVATDEFEVEAYRANDGQRCFHCKSALMKAMSGLALATADGRAGAALLIGAIADDFADVRPGLQAAAAAGARWPLADAGMTKDEVRARSRARGLPTWDRPAEPCLSSRIPYGEPVTPEAVRMVEAAEACLRYLGLSHCRARHHRVGAKADGGARGWLCRIEVPDADLERVLAARAELLPALRRIGYANVALDLAGLVSGGYNGLLSAGERADAVLPVRA
ncbi:MAG TPA: ATP-dependent sacrificial sulfur transferase LarE [Planctomycetota bacterium]|nr:ATP-dependent sacrificial sulfur transferase LarE [Planctomycetota bacterium]